MTVSIKTGKTNRTNTSFVDENFSTLNESKKTVTKKTPTETHPCQVAGVHPPAIKFTLEPKLFWVILQIFYIFLNHATCSLFYIFKIFNKRLFFF
jgi:hypothetical protein